MAHMHPSALLELSTELIRAVLKLEAPADAVVSSFFRRHRELGPRERQTLAETAYAVLRERLKWQHLAQSAGAGAAGPMERRLAMLAWQGSDTYLRGALEPTESDWLGRCRGVEPTALPEKLRHNMPDWLASALQREMGEGFWALVESLSQTAPLDLRVNTHKARREEVQPALQEAGIESTPTPYSPWGLRVKGKPALHKLPLFIRGDVEVQDEGSQMLALLTEARRGEMVVDFCAGAGGKTLALGAMMRNTGRLYAFDVSAHRLDALKPRLARSGLSNVHPAAIAHERDERIKRLAGKIDRVLVDAPCSGLGTLRRNPDLKWRHSPQTLEEMRTRQAAILASAARLLKPGGRLVYATCSLLRAENEDIVADFALQNKEFAPVPVADVLRHQNVPQVGSLVDNDYLRLWPYRHATDGFFAAVWQRK
jgi:16S rRNA (cytosine967-C5)-methyltransferase